MPRIYPGSRMPLQYMAEASPSSRYHFCRSRCDWEYLHQKQFPWRGKRWSKGCPVCSTVVRLWLSVPYLPDLILLWQRAWLLLWIFAANLCLEHFGSLQPKVWDSPSFWKLGQYCPHFSLERSIPSRYQKWWNILLGHKGIRRERKAPRRTCS